MTDPMLIADLVRAGVEPELIGRVSNALVNVRDNVRDNAVREHERDRKRNWRKTTAAQHHSASAKANDVAGSGADNVPRNVPDNAAKRCDLSSTSSLFPEVVTEEGSNKAQKVQSEKGARASRMIAGAVISEIDFQFALDQGAEPAAIRQAWAEFVDYWIGIPGQRGHKLDWPATWRNRVREVFCKGRKNGHGKQSLSERAFNLAEQARSAERAAGIKRPDDPVRGH